MYNKYIIWQSHMNLLEIYADLEIQQKAYYQIWSNQRPFLNIKKQTMQAAIIKIKLFCNFKNSFFLFAVKQKVYYAGEEKKICDLDSEV